MSAYSGDSCLKSAGQVRPAQCQERTLREGKSTRGGCNKLVGWCRKNGFWEGIMKLLHRRQFLHLAAATRSAQAHSGGGSNIRGSGSRERAAVRYRRGAWKLDG
jgi:hypothetical protein